MKKWAFFISAAVAAAVIGCGGGGGGSNPSATGSTGSTTGTALSSVNLPNNPGFLDVQFLTGAGRAPGDATAVINDISFQDTDGQLFDTGTLPSIRLLLAAFNLNDQGVNIPILSGNSRAFSSFNLIVQELDLEGGGTVANFDGSPIVNQTVATHFRVAPGRQTAIQVFLDDTMLSGTPGTPASNGNPAVPPTVNFDFSLFQSPNYDDTTHSINGFFSDYVMFDISNISGTKPVLSTTAPANKVYFSGDNIALSEGGPTGHFEILELLADVPGGGQFTTGTGNFPNTYQLINPSPGGPDPGANIASLQGIWRDYNSVIANAGAFEMIVFPNAYESYGTGSFNDFGPDMVMIQRDGSGTITNMYFGFVDFNQGAFSAWPIGNIVDATIDNEIDGLVPVSGLLGSNGGPILDGGGNPITTVADTATASQICSGSFTTTAGTPPSGFPAIDQVGRFIVFRQGGGAVSALTKRAAKPNTLKTSAVPHK